MKSIGQQIMQIDGLRGTGLINDWEFRFISSMVTKTECGKRTAHLSGNEVEKIEQIYNKHFA